MRLRPHAVMAIALLTLAGCQDSGLTRAALAKFAVGPTTSGSASEVSVGVTGKAAGDGVLTINFSSLLQSRRLLATLTDVHQVKVELVPVPMSAGAVQTQIVDKAALQGGTVTCTFSGLAAGNYTVQMSALDSTGQQLGSDWQNVSVQAGQSTTVTMTIRLDPTIPVASPAAGSGGGGSSPTTGSVTTNATIIDGLVFPPATAATIVQRRHYPTHTHLDIDADAAGQVFVGTSYSSVERLASNLALEQTYTIASAGFSGGQFALDADRGYIWLGNRKVSLAGVQTTTQADVEPHFGAGGTTTDTHGNYWSFGIDGKLRKYDTSGVLQFTIDTAASGDYFGQVERGPSGNVWCGVMNWDTDVAVLREFNGAGQKVSEHTLPYFRRMAVDSQNHVWMQRNKTLTKLKADGTVLASVNFPFECTLDIDAADNLWVHSVGRILKISPSGAALAAYTVPEDQPDTMSGFHFVGGFRVIDATHAVMVLFHQYELPEGSEVLKLQF